MKKVYFAGSIRGGRNDADLYQRLIAYIQKTDIVLTEHIGNLKKSHLEETEDDIAIWKQDMAWMEECDLVIAEASNPSLGVGYEMAVAEKLNKPVYIFYNKEKGHLSAMLTGDDYFHIYPYSKETEVYSKIEEILQNR